MTRLRPNSKSIHETSTQSGENRMPETRLETEDLSNQLVHFHGSRKIAIAHLNHIHPVKRMVRVLVSDTIYI